MSDQPPSLPARVQIIGRAMNATVAHAPWLWPALRLPMRRYFDGLAPHWDARTSTGSVRHLNGLATATAKIKPAPERILDVGTGTGEAALFLAREFPTASVRGVDLSEEMIREAREKVGLDPDGRIAFKVADAAHLPYDGDSFDLVAQINMPPFFAEIARVLRPGGHAIVVASNGPSTPFYTPLSVLEHGFRKRGFETVEMGNAGPSTYFLGRLAHG